MGPACPGVAGPGNSGVCCRAGEPVGHRCVRRAQTSEMRTQCPLYLPGCHSHHPSRRESATGAAAAGWETAGEAGFHAVSVCIISHLLATLGKGELNKKKASRGRLEQSRRREKKRLPGPLMHQGENFPKTILLNQIRRK